jgi:hypothetical protein
MGSEISLNRQHTNADWEKFILCFERGSCKFFYHYLHFAGCPRRLPPAGLQKIAVDSYGGIGDQAAPATTRGFAKDRPLRSR